MRSRGALALLLMLTLAGCGAKDSGDGVATANNGKPTATASSQPATNNEDAALKYAQCMRQHGMSWFPDPKPGGGMRIEVPRGQDKAKVDAAMEACKKYMPNGGNPPKLDAEALERARQMAKCMREHGVPNFPDPKPDGSLQLDGNKLGMGPGDPTFDAAEKACAQYGPQGPGAGTQRETKS
jgi:hypothetical protein